MNGPAAIPGGRVPLSHALAATLTRAADYARSQSHGAVTLEHVLLALTEDEDAVLVLESSQVDLSRLRNDVAQFLGQHSLATGPVGSQPAPSPELLRILDYAAAAARQSRRSQINGAIVLAATVGDGRSMAASFLKAQGLTFEAAIRAIQQAMVGRRPTAATGDASEGEEGGIASAQEPTPAAPISPTSQPDAPHGEASVPSSTEAILARARGRVEAVTQARSPSPGGAHSASPSPTQARVPVSSPPPVADSAAVPASPPPPVVPAGPVSPVSSAAAGPLVVPQHADLPSPTGPPPVPPALRTPTDAAADSGERSRSIAPTVATDPAVVAAPPTSVRPPAVPSRADQPLSGAAAVPPPSELPTPPHPMPAGVGRGPAPPPMPPLDRMPLPPAPSMRHVQRRTDTGVDAPVGAPWPQTTQQRTPPVPPSYLDAGDTIAGPPYPEPDSVPPPRARLPDAGRGRHVDTIQPGQLVESIPRRMKVAVAYIAEVRISRDELADIARGMQGGPAVGRHAILTTRAMSVRLKSMGNALRVEALSPETQWIDGSVSRLAADYAVWRFTIVPERRGPGDLLLTVASRAIGGDGVVAETALPDQAIRISVSTNYGLTARRWGGWIAAAIVGGILAKIGEAFWSPISATIGRLFS